MRRCLSFFSYFVIYIFFINLFFIWCDERWGNVIRLLLLHGHGWILVGCQLNCGIACGASCNSESKRWLFLFLFYFIRVHSTSKYIPVRIISFDQCNHAQTHTRADHKPLTFTRRVIVVISLHLLPHFHTFLYVRVCVFRCLDVLLHRYVDLSDLHRFFRWITLNWSRFEERQNNSKKKWTLIRAIHFINDIRLVGWIQRWKNVSITSMIDSTYRNLVDDATCRKCGSGPIADRLSFSSVNFVFFTRIIKGKSAAVVWDAMAKWNRCAIPLPGFENSA